MSEEVHKDALAEDVKSVRAFFLQQTADVNLKWFFVGFAAGVALVLLRGLLVPLLLTAFVLYIVLRFLTATTAEPEEGARAATETAAASPLAANSDVPVRDRAQRLELTSIPLGEARAKQGDQREREQREPARYKPPKPSRKAQRAQKSAAADEPEGRGSRGRSKKTKRKSRAQTSGTSAKTSSRGADATKTKRGTKARATKKGGKGKQRGADSASRKQ